MLKGKINITMDQDLIDFIKDYAGEERTTVSEMFSQFVLHLKRKKTVDPMDIILSDSDFQKSLIETIAKIRTGKMKWHGYDEIFP